MLADQVIKLDVKVKGYEVKYGKVKGLLAEALSHRDRLERAVKAIATREGTCWCGVKAFKLRQGGEYALHTVACDQLYLALYGAERGE
jgi:hypothetical protein